MPLKLAITSYQRLSPGQEITKILDRGSLSIGRAAQTDWILQDPERILSGKHCTIHHRDGHYYLTDNSTNGTFINDSEERVPRNQTVKLNDGDRFVLGEYEIAVTLLPGAAELAEVEPDGPATDVVPGPGASSPFAADLIDAGVEPDRDPARPGKPSFTDLFSEDSLGLKRPASPPPQGRSSTEPSADLLAPDRAFFEPPALIPETPPPASPASPSAPSSPPVDQFAEPEIPEPGVLEPGVLEPMAPVSDQRAPDIADLPPFEPPAAPEPPASVAEPGAAPIIPEDWWMTPATPPSEARSTTEPAPDLPSPRQPLSTPPVETPAFTPRPPEPLLDKLDKPAKPTILPTPEPPPQKPLPAPPAPTADAASPGPDTRTLIQAFLRGAGLPNAHLNDQQWPEVLATIGAIFRETVQGLMEILLARGDIKGEFRLDRTAIGPVDNNPLKTPPGQPPLRPEEVMILLLTSQKNAYMSPTQAVHEGFNDIKAHQLAVMAGIQAALTRLLERFDPSNLESRLQPNVLDSILPGSRKAKYWDLFTNEYQAIAREAEDDFNELFGDEFARAYEERLRGR